MSTNMSVQRSANGRLIASTTTTHIERVLPNEEVSLASRPDTQMNLSTGTESASANAEADVDINLHHPTDDNSHHPNNGSHCADNNDLDTQINTVDEELPALHRQQAWAAQQHQTYLEELYQLEGRGSANGNSNLSHYRWYPASPTTPCTAFTLDLLNTFQLLTLQGKISAYDFYLSIERKTDNAGIKGLQLCYDQFLTCVRQFRHLRMLKRAGLGMDPEPVSSTKDGGYTVDCPACPHPGINIPADWETEPESTRHLENDKALGDGWGHWVPEGPYKSHLDKNANDPEPNLCDSELCAVDHANKRRLNGYISTGVASVVCVRHGLVRRNRLGNLQKGERYANTDFIVLSTLKNNPFVRLVLSYDICCQWSRNFLDCMANFPESMHLSDEAFDHVTYIIPKFHLYGHRSKCQTTYSLSYILWSAETDGKDPERWWAHINPVSMSIKIMGLGSRMDTIDDHAATWNWWKIVDLEIGNSLHARFQKVVSMSARHTALHDEYTTEFNEEDITIWKQMIVDWESDRTKPNPFEETNTYLSMAAVHLELAREEVTEPAHAQSNSPNKFLYKGLEIEELQQVVSTSQKEKTTLQAAELQERHNNLANLLLPSQLPLSAELAPMQTREARIRIAQADDSLLELCRLLRITAGLVDYKYTQVGFGQGPNTRAHSQITCFKSKITLVAERYHAAYQALLCLDPQGSWITRLRKLEDNDIRWPTHNPDEAEGTCEISWIWQVEWAKSYACAAHWDKEVSLVIEEMRRVAAHLSWKAEWWKTRCGQ
ncbi:hypothetical protein BDN71DRAFT_1555892 [Pleurotus eryngii]|uniref:CxC2-like cysteine cluster KDZ transposase-associated domain-containing protein n=1 Tax=Pleurotus eryngii TaxID=5323 RepID=A0A9P6AA71_PLEER|nr:hypothetical protein BDN71DRAFT_1555892 [Pleurotus eryngii]